MNAAETWEHLRATRSRPPEPVCRTDERRGTYRTALEQAQQMFRAASHAGMETQPLLIFYGLSQAGRAIAAAAESVSATDDGWRLKGHGITPSGTLTRPLPDISIDTNQRPGGSFVTLSNLLYSQLPPHKSAMRLQDAWDCIPGNHDWPIGSNEAERRTPLRVDTRDQFPEPKPWWSVWVEYLPAWLQRTAQPGQELIAYLDDYPGAHGGRNASSDSLGNPLFQTISDRWRKLDVYWEFPDQTDDPDGLRRYLVANTRRYKGERWFFPAIAGTDSMHPVMAWWAVLFTLSMLARYQPAEWAAHIAVNNDGSPAVAIERLLRNALTTVPQLILETIQDIAEPIT